ncbi:MAG TPA: ATP-binding protein, partial [Bryobacteraceae bacterium]|nr:ATP-binding protein [Bryobacteraceae bacterium]
WRQWAGAGLGRETVRALEIAGDGALWVGSARGDVVRIDTRTHTARRHRAEGSLRGQRITGLAFDLEGRIWAAARNGLYRAGSQTSTLRLERQSPPASDENESFTKVLRSANGAIWATGNHGLVRFKDGQWARFTTRDGLVDNNVTHFTEAPDGSIWVGYRERKGLSRLVYEGGRIRVSHMGGNEGLRSQNVVFVGSDRQGRVWSGTDSGLDVFEGSAWRHYGSGDGLVWEDCDGDSFLADDDGSVWIGTSRGVSHFRPPQRALPSPPPDALVTAVLFGNRPIDPTRPAAAAFRDRSMRVRFTALTFLNESAVRFRYRLLDLHRDWIETGQREIDYPGLAHGNYTFEVLARNALGVWSETPARFTFEVRPPWWRTWWFHTAWIGLLVLAAWQIWRLRMRQLLAQQERLEEAVAGRTSELVREKATIDVQNREIELLLRKAQAASRAKSAFLANMSHEIRTPLNGVVGMTELMMGTELNQEQREYVQGTRDSADALLGVLNDILDLSKIEAGWMELNPAPFSVRHLVAESVGLFRFQTAHRGLDLEWEVDDDVPEAVIGDAIRLRQILLNLIGNAAKFTERGSVWVRVAVDRESHPQPGIRLRWSVSDTGIGIPPEQHDLIFEAFRQADNSSTRKYGGTGLGLAICARLVELMQGRIWVESAPGQGSTFHFTTLVQAADENPDSLQERPARSRGGIDISRPPRRRLAVLLAEDNAVNQKLGVRLLEKRGHSVTVAANGCEAVALSERESFDVVLMDVHMPEMDGFEATERIRQRERRARTYTPIIALTANAMAGDREKCLQAGMDGYINKPVDLARLIRAVEGIADAGGVQRGVGEGI